MTIKIGDYEVTTIFTGQPWCENCYLVSHIPSSEQVLIDPGDDAQLIIKTIIDKKGSLKNILITHAHHDHVGAVGLLHQRFGVSCYLHKMEERLIRRVHTYAFAFDRREMEPFTSPCLFLDEGLLKIGKQQIQLIYTPGHTPGGCCYCFGDFIFTGDTIMHKHVGRVDLPGSNMDQLTLSVNRLIEELPDETIIFPGHGRNWRISEAKQWWRGVYTSPPQYAKFGII